MHPPTGIKQILARFCLYESVNKKNSTDCEDYSNSPLQDTYNNTTATMATTHTEGRSYTLSNSLTNPLKGELRRWV